MGQAFKIQEQVEILKKASSNFQAIKPLDLHQEKPVYSLHVSPVHNHLINDFLFLQYVHKVNSENTTKIE
jgi:hypothetical protein